MVFLFNFTHIKTQNTMKNLYFIFILMLVGIPFFAQPGSQSSLLNINSYQPFQGYDETSANYGKGEYQIFYDNVNGVFDKPFIIVDGYDPNDERSIQTIYNSFNYNSGANNYLTDWRNQGFDMVILNFPTYVRTSDGVTVNGGADFIERNGQVLVNLLLTLSPQIPSANSFSVFGPSMGGLISRYALRFMEQNGLNHRTALWFSFDSPHLGANVPISLQYMLNYYVETAGTTEEQTSKDLILNNPAAKQMLLDHYTAHLQSGSEYLQNTGLQLPTPHAFRTTFMNTMNTMGFPTLPRNISISNGVVNGIGTETPGVLVINTTLDLGSGATSSVRMHYTPTAGTINFEVDYMQNYWFGIPLGSAFITYAASHNYTSGYDTAPGSTRSLSTMFGDNPTGVMADIVNALQVDTYCFVPTVSSLAVNNQNIYTPITSGSITAFDSYYVPTVNEEHLTFTQPSIQFITNELLNYYLAIPNQLQLNDFKLLQNPVQNKIILQSTALTQNIVYQYEIINSLGKVLQKGQFSNQNSTIQIPVSLEASFYILKIKQAEKTQSFKIVVQ